MCKNSATAPLRSALLLLLIRFMGDKSAGAPKPLLPAAPELLLAVSEGALVPVAAGSRIRPVLTHNCLDVGPLTPASPHSRPAEAPVDVCSELSIVCCQMQEFAIVPKVTVTLKHLIVESIRRRNLIIDLSL